MNHTFLLGFLDDIMWFNLIPNVCALKSNSNLKIRACSSNGYSIYTRWVMLTSSNAISCFLPKTEVSCCTVCFNLLEIGKRIRVEQNNQKTEAGINLKNTHRLSRLNSDGSLKLTALPKGFSLHCSTFADKEEIFI